MEQALLALVIGGDDAALALIFHHAVRKERGLSPLKDHFLLSDIDDDKCLLSFRFTQDEIQQLIVLFRLPDSSSHASACEAICILLERLAYRCRRRSLEGKHYRSASGLSNLFYWDLEFVSA